MGAEKDWVRYFPEIIRMLSVDVAGNKVKSYLNSLFFYLFNIRNIVEKNFDLLCVYVFMDY
jgi:hypothetical protein